MGKEIGVSRKDFEVAKMEFWRSQSEILGVPKGEFWDWDLGFFRGISGKEFGIPEGNFGGSQSGILGSLKGDFGVRIWGRNLRFPTGILGFPVGILVFPVGIFPFWAGI